MADKILFRRDIPENWTRFNPVLALGEPGYEVGSGKIKVGDGRTPWTELDYIAEGASSGVDDGTAQALITAHINSLTPHSVYDDGPSLLLLYQNAKV